LAGTAGLSFEATVEINAIITKRHIREKITSDNNEAKNILKKLLISILYSAKSKRIMLLFL